MRHPWLWRCPHCLGGNMKLPSALRHLKRKHRDCFSCRAETLMVSAMIEGRGAFIIGDIFARRPGSRV